MPDSQAGSSEEELFESSTFAQEGDEGGCGDPVAAAEVAASEGGGVDTQLEVGFQQRERSSEGLARCVVKVEDSDMEKLRIKIVLKEI